MVAYNFSLVSGGLINPHTSNRVPVWGQERRPVTIGDGFMSDAEGAGACGASLSSPVEITGHQVNFLAKHHCMYG